MPERTRATLVDAALELFLEDGLDGPSLDAICEKAGYTRGAFYVHFASREELIAAAVEKAIGELIVGFLGEGPATTVADTIGAFVVAVEQGRFPPSRRVRVSQLLEACMRSADLRMRYLTLLLGARERLATVVRQSQQTGATRPDVAPESIAELLLALVLGVLVAVQVGAPYDARAVADDLRRVLEAP